MDTEPQREAQAALKLVARTQALAAAFQPSPSIQAIARNLPTTNWPEIAKSYGFGQTILGAEATRALAGLAAHENLVLTHSLGTFRANAAFRVAENVQRTLADIGLTATREVEDSLRPLRENRRLFEKLAVSAWRSTSLIRRRSTVAGAPAASRNTCKQGTTATATAEHKIWGQVLGTDSVPVAPRWRP